MKGRAGAWRALPLWLALAALFGGAYLAFAGFAGLTGFPLDDAWIHQTYARNLGTTGVWAFLPGQVSAGSTAPLWSLLLAFGYWLGAPYLAWTHGLGIAALGVSAWLAAGQASDWAGQRRWMPWLVGLACLAEWHLVWAAVSGMETVLYVCLALAVVRLASGGSQMANDRHQISNDKHQMTNGKYRAAVSHFPFGICHLRFLVLGLVGGLLVLTRPEGLLLVGLTGVIVGWQLRRACPLAQGGDYRRRLLAAWALLWIGLALPLAPYLAFHYSYTGQPFPSTFYAKQQEYRVLLDSVPFWQRWLSTAGVTLVGGQVLLLPGFVWALVKTARPGVLLLAAWWLAHLTLYALRLPVTYQHGRYQMPVIAAFVMVGVLGTAELLDAVRQPVLGRVLRRAGLAAGGLLSAAFLVVGARAYVADVGFIRGEMVATAHWLVAHTPAGSLIAVHDIGAVGYFAGRPLLDLAGLVTPQVIPFIDDEAALLDLMETQGADYVVFFPDWSAAYRQMARDPRLELVHTTGYAWTLQAGRANMAVYRFQSTWQ
jgi:hypothetical protein